MLFSLEVLTLTVIKEYTCVYFKAYKWNDSMGTFSGVVPIFCAELKALS